MLKESKANFNIISNSIRELIIWCNGDHTRMGQTSYYITLNIGLAKNNFARKIAEILLEQFNNLGDLVFKPNIVFLKYAIKINLNPGDPNYDLYIKIIKKITAKNDSDLYFM
ncbi:MAG: hypothetical protein L6U99_13475 [Clostridium sp.]|nr:MAG: hypothetical protein L6U99_13475 [Clostridium sp.]